MEIGAIGWIGILLGLSSVTMVVGRGKGTGRIALVLALAATQIAVSIYFYNWALTNTTDATTYYYDPYEFYGRGFGLSTQFVVWLVQSIKETFGGSYLDFFLLFQATGTWGIVFVLKSIDELFEQAGQQVPWQAVAILFLPGLHFWTAYIGKDGGLFLATAMAGWAAFSIWTRWPAFMFSIVIMIMLRPHIALLALSAAAIALVLDKRTARATRFALTSFAVVGLAVTVGTIRSTFEVDVTNADSVADFLASRGETVQRIETGEASGLSFPSRVFSLLFRPLFFDAQGALGLIASFENLVLVYLIGLIAVKFRWTKILFQRLFVIRYAAFFALALTLLLSIVYYNVGLGLRQKMMMMPAIIVMFSAVLATTRVVRPARKLRAQPA